MCHLGVLEDFALKYVHRHLSSEVVYLAYAIKVGSRHESLRQHGIAHFIEHLLFKGTLSRSSKDIIQEIEGIGGELNAFTSKEETIVYCIVPKKYCASAIDLLTDIVQNSQFPEEEFKKEKGVVIDEIYSYEDSPSELIFDEFENLLFRGHYLGHNILGTEASVQRLSRKHCLEFYKKHYCLDNMVFFAQGDFQDLDLGLVLMESLQRNALPKESKQSLGLSSQKGFEENEIRRVQRRKGTHQCHILLGGLAYAQKDKRKLALSFLVNILGGGGLNSRLNTILREERGLVYQAEANYTAYSDTGIVAIYLACAKSSKEEVLSLVEQELERLSTDPLSDDELSRAKRQFLGQLLLSTENREHIFLSMGKSFLHYGKVESIDELKKRVEAITSEDLFAIAKEVFRKDQFSHLLYK